MSDPIPDILAIAERFRIELLGKERAAATAMTRYYGWIWKDLHARLDDLLSQMPDNAGVTWILREDRLNTLLRETAQQIGQFARYAEQTVANDQREAVRMAQDHAPQLVLPLLPPERASVGVVWNRVPVEALTHLAGQLHDGSPLHTLLETLGPEAAEGMKKALITGLGTGQNPREIARLARQSVGMPLTRALTIARTETLRAYRESARAGYQANDDVVKAWRWLCEKGPRTCPACLAMDGTEFPLDVPMGTHPNCRCAPVPVTKSWAELGFAPDEPEDLPPPRETGAEWFARQTPEVQDLTLGKAGGAAYREGLVRLADFVGEKVSRKWGVTRYTLSLKEAIRHRMEAQENPRLIKTPEWFKAPQNRYPDAASAVRRQFATVAEAEEFARSLGVQGVHYEDRLDIAQLANEFLARLQDRGLQMPVTMMAHSAFFAARFGQDQIHIPAMAESSVILINPEGDYWQDPLLNSRRAFALRLWSTPSPLHVLWHEYAHLSQAEVTRNKPLTPKQKTLAASISVRAGENVEEFLCEVYAGLMEGVQYDSDILRAYSRLGGKRP